MEYFHYLFDVKMSTLEATGTFLLNVLYVHIQCTKYSLGNK